MRARILRFLLAAITVSASMTRSASAAGVDLAWDDCGVYGTMLKTFSCNSNVGLPFMLYGSFVPPPDIDQFVGIAAQVDVCTMTSSFVDWWAHGTGYCRGTNATARARIGPARIRRCRSGTDENPVRGAIRSASAGRSEYGVLRVPGPDQSFTIYGRRVLRGMFHARMHHSERYPAVPAS